MAILAEPSGCGFVESLFGFGKSCGLAVLINVIEDVDLCACALDDLVFLAVHNELVFVCGVFHIEAKQVLGTVGRNHDFFCETWRLFDFVFSALGDSDGDLVGGLVKEDEGVEPHTARIQPSLLGQDGIGSVRCFSAGLGDRRPELEVLLSLVAERVLEIVALEEDLT